VVAACGISCCGFSSSWSGVELRVMRPVCRMLVYSKPAKLMFILDCDLYISYAFNLSGHKKKQLAI